MAGRMRCSFVGLGKCGLPFAHEVPVVFREHPESLDQLGIASARDIPMPFSPPGRRSLKRSGRERRAPLADSAAVSPNLHRSGAVQGGQTLRIGIPLLSPPGRGDGGEGPLPPPPPSPPGRRSPSWPGTSARDGWVSYGPPGAMGPRILSAESLSG